jgi:hypothetical protein
MNVVSLHDPSPKDVTFFIGPVGSPSSLKEDYQKAVEQSAAGNTDALDELLEIQTHALQDLAKGTEIAPPPLKGFIESLIDCEIGNYSVFVSKGYMERTWTPLVTIHLDRLTGIDGSPIGHLLTKRHGEVVAALLGQTFKAEWIYTSWVYPGTPVEFGRKFMWLSYKGAGHPVREDQIILNA